ncbi:DUF3369 domain-containing protein [Corallincola holothuriorum]|uniref:DUF3369 domain-containing protein n=1 Tax=Corallincola holothuriorum TaxID=2282215 RepID=A0A368N4R5_9GAMM|nr:DUF3369 domain-containing protein [Corallincola holothuriorum]RCU45498.1 DUF3369 domain-containing protein [Corallincola holothuriorum]
MDDKLLFSEEEVAVPSNHDAQQFWHVLIADDEPAVHQITTMVLGGMEVQGRPLKLISAYTGEEALQVMAEREDIALALLDVVMETPDAGLNCARVIREEMKNKYTRLVLRTGQPGQAPEEQVIRDYDINDYKDKTELTSTKMKTLVYSTIRSYRDICTVNQSRKGLRRVIDAISEVNESHTLRTLASAILDQIINLLGLQSDAICCRQLSAYAASVQEGHYHVLATSGDMDKYKDVQSIDELPAEVANAFKKASETQGSFATEHYYVCYKRSHMGAENLLYLEYPGDLTDLDQQLLEIYASNVGLTYENLLIREEVEDTQRELVYILGEAVEGRSKETGAHVKRVAKISHFLALSYGLDEESADLIKYASPLHDIGKIGIADSILNKPGKLDDVEWQTMQTHANFGETLLARSGKRILKLASVIAGQHHERWDGTGYPRGLAGEEIDVAARITAVADVLDALASQRCYKEAWSYDKIVDLMQRERGKQFEPRLVDLLIENFEQIKAIRARYPD